MEACLAVPSGKNPTINYPLCIPVHAICGVFCDKGIGLNQGIWKGAVTWRMSLPGGFAAGSVGYVFLKGLFALMGFYFYLTAHLQDFLSFFHALVVGTLF